MSGSTLEGCLARVAARGTIGKAGALEMLQHVADRAEDMRRTGTPDPYVAAAADLGRRMQDNARLDRLDSLRNAAKRQAILNKITGFENAEQVLRDALHGSNVGGRESVQALSLGNTATWQSAVSWELQKAGLEQAAITGEMDREIARAMWDRNAGAAATASGPAGRIAAVFGPALDLVRNRLNAVGARIGDAKDYVTHTSHDPRLMRRGGRSAPSVPVIGKIPSVDEAFAKWWGLVQPRLAEKTFDGVEDRDAFGRSVFEALISGIHMTPAGSSGVEAGENAMSRAFEGTRNLGRKVSQQRVLFWKDADSWIDYANEYGRYRTLHESVMGSMREGARDVALMDKFGTNPAGNLKTIIRRVQEKYRPDLDGGSKFAGKIAGIQNVMDRLDGTANIPVNEQWHSLTESARSYYNMTSLGGVGITHLASVWSTIPGELRHHGANRFKSLGMVVKSLLPGKSAQFKEIAHDLGAYSDGWTYNLARNWNVLFEPGQSLAGRVSAIQNIFMRTTGIHYVFDNVRAGVREWASANLGRQRDSSFGRLDPHLQQVLSKYGIKESEWDELRSLPNLTTFNGRTYITPKDALQTSFGQELADKLIMYNHDIADHSIVSPGVREQARLYGSSRPGEGGYMLKRALFQFKIWPLAAMNQIIGRELHMSLSKADAAWGLGLTIGLSALAGYGRMAINDIATGRPPRNPMSFSTMLAGLAQGGGLGILGDFAFGETSRMGSGLIGVAGGPMTADADDLLKIYGRWRADMAAGDPKAYQHMMPDLAHFAVRHVPFANLVYVKGALDYMLWYHLFEAASPGWWDRTNARLAKEQGRTMTGYTPGGGVPWGVPGLYLGNSAGQSSGLIGRGS